MAAMPVILDVPLNPGGTYNARTSKVYSVLSTNEVTSSVVFAPAAAEIVISAGSGTLPLASPVIR